jgi:SET domain-containing protein
MVFKAKRDIQAGEELFDSYISCDVPREERQKTLKQRYGFHCACSRCNKEKYETSY